MSDPKQGGDLNDMAKDGTTMPNDAGKMRVLPSVPNPHQMTENNEAGGGLGATGADVADNPTDIPRNPRDMSSATSEAITGMGDQMPGEQGTKSLHFSGANAMAKGSDRYDKHTRSKESEYDEKGVDMTREGAGEGGGDNR